MKKAFVLILVLILLCGAALAEVPHLSGQLFDSAKGAVNCLASGAYDRLAAELPVADAGEWADFAADFADLSGAQTQYAVAFWRGGSWYVAVPIREPANERVETLVLSSADGKHVDGYRRAPWGKVQSAYRGSDYLYWNQEYTGGGAMLMADE